MSRIFRHIRHGIGGLGVLSLILLVAQNGRAVTLEFAIWSINVPLLVILLITSVTGILLGVLIMLSLRRSNRRAGT